MVYLLTFSTYGSHLPGDARGSIDRHKGYRSANPSLERYSQKVMREPLFLLARPEDRLAVQSAITELCAAKAWNLIALHVRTTHVHLVVDADATPERVLQSSKAYATKALKKIPRLSSGARQNFWTRSGHTRKLPDLIAVNRAVRYVLEGQGESLARDANRGASAH